MKADKISIAIAITLTTACGWGQKNETTKSTDTVDTAVTTSGPDTASTSTRSLSGSDAGGTLTDTSDVNKQKAPGQHTGEPKNSKATCLCKR